MEEWKKYKIGDLCSISSSKRIFAKEYQSSGVPFFRGKEIIEKQKGGSISTELYISRSRYEEIKIKYGVPKEGDMLLTSVGTLGVPFMEEKKEQHKKSIRFFNDREVRAVWDEESNCWWFSATDIVRAINDEPDYTKAGNYWRWLKRKLKQEGIEPVSATHNFKFEAPDGKMRIADVLDSEGVTLLAKHYPNNRANEFLDWFTYSDNTLDGQSRKKAYQLYESGLLKSLEPGSIQCLQQIHAYFFGGLYDFAGQIRTKNISKGGFTFANCMHFPATLQTIERMPENTFDEIMDKYVEMNVAHPFMEGNGRSTRIWLDLMLRRSLKRCVDWSQIDKNEYLSAMRESVSNSMRIKTLVKSALTTKIDDREMFMKGIDYSYYYEQND